MTRRLTPLLLLLAAACGGSKASPPPTTAPAAQPVLAPGTTPANIQSRGYLVVGVKFDQPGLGLRNPETDQLEGFDVEMAKLVARGIFGDDRPEHLHFVEAQSANREALLESGKVDMVAATYTMNAERAQRVDFAGPYYVAHQDVLFRLDQPLTNASELADQFVCTARGATSGPNIKRAISTVRVVEADTYSACVQGLRAGQVRAVTTDDVILLGLMAASPTEFATLGLDLTDEPYGIAVHKGDESLRSFIDAQLHAAYADGEWAAAFANTLGRIGLETPPPPGQP